MGVFKLLLLSVLVVACGQEQAQVKSSSNTAPTLVDRVFAPINVVESDKKHNEGENIAIDMFEMSTALTIAYGNRYDAKPITTTRSLLPDSWRAHGMPLKPGQLTEIGRNFEAAQTELIETAGKDIVNTQVKIIYQDVRFAHYMHAASDITALQNAIHNFEVKAGSNLTSNAILSDTAKEALHKGSAELQILRQAQDIVGELQSNPDSKVFLQNNATLHDLRSSLKQIEVKQAVLKRVDMKTIEQPVLSAGRKLISRTIYVIVVLDIANDLYNGFKVPQMQHDM